MRATRPKSKNQRFREIGIRGKGLSFVESGTVARFAFVDGPAQPHGLPYNRRREFGIGRGLGTDGSGAIGLRLFGAKSIKVTEDVQHCNPQIQSCVSASCCLPKFVSYGLMLMFQKNPESKAVRNQQQRHNDSRNEVSRSQLPRQQPGMTGLVESI